MDIRFVELSSIDVTCFDKPYFLVPGKGSLELNAAIESEGIGL